MDDLYKLPTCLIIIKVFFFARFNIAAVAAAFLITLLTEQEVFKSVLPDRRLFTEFNITKRKH